MSKDSDDKEKRLARASIMSKDSDDEIQQSNDHKKDGNVSPTYEREEVKYAAEEKEVKDTLESKSKPAQPISDHDLDQFIMDTEGDFNQKFQNSVKAAQKSRELDQ